MSRGSDGRRLQKVARASCKEHVLETAIGLFNRDGFHATGVDTIIDEAEVSRMTLYNNFASKDALIETALARQEELIEAWVMSVLEGAGPADVRFNNLFDELGRRWNSDEFYGCPFTKAVGEYSCPDHPAHQAAVRHKQTLITMVAGLLQQMDVPNATFVATQVMLIIDGAAVRAQTFGDSASHELARSAAHAVVETARR